MPSTVGATSGDTCFNCGCLDRFARGHARECPAPKKNAAQDHITHPPCGPQKVIVAKTDCVNYTTMEDIPEGKQVLTNMFSLNGCPIVILFDFGVTHDFISKACIQKSQLIIQHISTPYLIKILGGKINTNQLVKNAPLNLGGKEYKTCLIVLEGQGIDVILGMDWMKAHMALLDIATQVVHLDSLIYGTHVLQLSSSSAVIPSVHHTTAQNLEDIIVTCEFPDVFPEDLLGMPSD
jgi:hypothetical protein